MEGNILTRVRKSIIKRDKRENLIIKGIIILMSLFFLVNVVEVGIMLAVSNMIVLVALIWIVLKVEELRNRR